MTEDVLDEHPIKQMNDYAISKWVNELQVLNSAARFGTETVRVRLFNTYGPGEYYTPYRSVICRVRLLRAARASVHGVPRPSPHEHLHRRLRADACRTSPTSFTPGDVYNIAGDEYHDISTLSDTILNVARQGRLAGHVPRVREAQHARQEH